MDRNHAVALGAAFALALTLPGCSDDGADPEGKPTPPISPPAAPSNTVPPAPAPEARAAAQLEQYLKVRDRAYRERDINFTSLNRVATGEEYLQLQSHVAGLANGNVTVSGQYVHTLESPRRHGKSVLIVDCENRVKVTHKKDGVVRNPDFTDPNGSPLRNPVPVEYTLIRDKGRWKVSDSDLKWDRPC